MAIMLVVTTGAGSTDGNTVTTGAIDTTGATLIVIVGSGASLPTLSDSKGNSYTLGPSHFGGMWTFIAYVVAPTVGSGHTFTAAGSSIYTALVVMAFSGVALASPLDQTNSSDGTGTSGQPGSLTPSEPGELIISSIAFGASNTMAIGSGLTIDGQVDYVGFQHYGCAGAYAIQSAAAAVNPTWSWGASAAYVTAIASFKAVAAPSPRVVVRRTVAAGVDVDEEWVGPFASWANVKTVYGAVGDGVTDDTTALQAAFDEVGTTGEPTVLYFPAGTYLTTSELLMEDRLGVSVVGEDPATTTIRRTSGGAVTAILHLVGVAYSRFSRLTLDGDGVVERGVHQSWDNLTGPFDTGNEFSDCVFQGVVDGIHGGLLGYGFAEISILRCHFIGMAGFGVWLGNFNALDVFVWSCRFEDCGVGISNYAGAGNWRAYQNVFLRSTNADLMVQNTGAMSFRDNVSLDSKMFLYGFSLAAPCPLHLQGNVILDSTQHLTIHNENQGPMLLTDNIIRSLSGATAPIVSQSASPNSDTIAVGNTFTIASPLTAGRLIEIDTSVVTRASLLSLTAPSAKPPPPNRGRQIFEVAAASSAATIQAAIDAAAAVAGTRPVVHLPAGGYSISTTLVIPTETDLQLVGDGHYDVNGTHLSWNGGGSGLLLTIHGPSKATLRDLNLDGNDTGTGLLIDDVDQVGSRVSVWQTQLTQGSENNLYVDGLDHALIDIRDVGHSQTFGPSILVRGGTLANADTPAGGRTIIFSGASSNNELSYGVLEGGNLLVRDMWFESALEPRLIQLGAVKGILTLDGNRISVEATGPAIDLAGFEGRLALLTSDIDTAMVISGDGTDLDVLGLGILSSVAPALTTTASPGADARVLNHRTKSGGGASTQATNIGTVDSTFITTMLAHTRQAHPTPLPALSSALPVVSDVRLFRVWVKKGVTGILIQP